VHFSKYSQNSYLHHSKLCKSERFNDFVLGLNSKTFKKETLDCDNYISIVGILQIIGASTDDSYIEPTQKQCHELLTQLRSYLIKHDALGE
jgi:hypothetical protein